MCNERVEAMVSLRNNQLKFKAQRKLPIDLVESMEYPIIS